MVASVIQGCLDVNNWITSNHTTIECLLNTLLHSWAVLLWHHTSLDFIEEFVALAWLVRLKAHPDITVLATTTRLLGMLTLRLGGALDGLAVGDLRLTNVSLNVELALHAVDQNL